MLLISIYVGSCDFAYRNLAILSSLTQRPGGVEFLNKSLVDMLGLRSLWCAIRQRLIAVALAQILVIICGFLTTMISVVFTVEDVPESRVIQLQQTTWFGSREIEYSHRYFSNRKLLGSLALSNDSMVTYPRDTFDDLIFPTIHGPNTASIPPNTSFEMIIPAAKLNHNCEKLQNFNYSMLFYDEERAGYGPSKPYRPTFYQSFHCPNGSSATLKEYEDFFIDNTDANPYFSKILKSPGNNKDINATCGGLSDEDNYSAYRFQTYVWGKFSRAKKDFEYLSIWRCKYSWIEVPTKVNLLSVDDHFILDPQNQPQPDLSDLRPWTPSFDVPHLNDQFLVNGNRTFGDSYPSGSVLENLPVTFSVLLRPQGRFLRESLGDQSEEAEILGALNHNYAAMAAQLASVENRFLMNESSRTRAAPINDDRDLDAVMITSGRRRLVQNAKITYVILSIIGLTVLINAVALLLNISQRVLGETWIFDMEVQGLAPDRLHSISSTASLLQNSNVSDYLPHVSRLIPAKELLNQLSGLRFRFGWFQDRDQGRHYTIGVLGSDDYEFISNRKDFEKED
ncbi:hypothetical protein CGMCC3_g17035 [Colletotrichum fructicola]|uniref:Uncharacterized protein n=1 Tax=Colletotrichum fructicola (strain Nara gc5) TaxID=1213859 RepID=L2GC30_COLFN|nr:uncharacterized protein CGMCC3_g17035 [Colletotrichum fructicola]KAE9566809.1 hypothetical protein CGMCC3_g17035 [Colletotrichum fructicola]KAF4482497.1 hypothetical protein CGGC5_v009207 [Colletotrichum fructicola Nara gc5]KAF4883601.1 hypothetical protein CGCFRS4_v013427 [Colletotrichum fructicola]